MKKRTIYIIGALVLLIVLLLVLKGLGVIGKSDGTKVAVAKADYKDIIQTVSASGKIYPEVVVSISSDVSGEIVSLPVQEGDSVTKGDVVSRIYADIYNSMRSRSAASVNQAKAQLANARASQGATEATLAQTKADFERSKQLFDEKVISEQKYDQDYSAYQQALANYKAAQQQINSASFAVKAAEADLQQATDNVHRTTILAPMSGYVIYLPVKEGERVVGTAQMAGTEIMRVADMSTIEVQVNVGENDVSKVYLDDTALIEVDAYMGRKFKGVVTQIASSSQDIALQTSATSALANATGVTNYTIHIRILKDSYHDLIDPKHPEHFPFRPGMSANVDIQTEHERHILAVPIAAVSTRDDLPAGDSTQTADSSRIGTDSASNGITEEADSNSQVGGDKKHVVVFVLQPDKTVKMVPVKTGIQDGFNIQILSGLKEGQQVVSAPYTAISQLLKDGSKVKVVPQAQLFQAK